MMNKEIDQDIEALRMELQKDRMYLGQFPLCKTDDDKWNRIYEENKLLAKSINDKINKYNLIVPLMSKQRFHVEFDEMAHDVLENGRHSFVEEITPKKKDTVVVNKVSGGDFMGLFLKALFEVFRFGREEKKKNDLWLAKFTTFFTCSWKKYVVSDNLWYYKVYQYKKILYFGCFNNALTNNFIFTKKTNKIHF